MSSSPSSRPAKRHCESAEAPGANPRKSSNFSHQNRFFLGAATAALLLASPVGQALADASHTPSDTAAGRPSLGLYLQKGEAGLTGLHADQMVTGTIPSKAKRPKMGLLGSLEFKIEQTPFQAIWATLLARVTEELPFYMSCKGAEKDCSAGLRNWQSLLHSLQDLSPKDQLEKLNPAINDMAQYADDDVIYGVEDYWATPAEFFKGRADCEDYALVKLFSLLELGFAPDQLRLAIVKDRRRQVLHAILAVRLDGKTYVMDSLETEPVEQQTVLKYEPIYSLNTKERWAHIVTAKTKSLFLAELNQSQPEREKPTTKPRAELERTIVESTLYGPGFVTPLRPGRERAPA
jgi:predicted transglutaminase-like cysteine proteinase